MHSGAVSWMVYSSLASFWPGVQVMVGDIEAAVQTQYSIHSLWRRFGGMPEVSVLFTFIDSGVREKERE